MGLFDPRVDPRDTLIEHLKEEVLYLRAKLGERDQSILALTNAQAFRLMNPYESSDAAGPEKPTLEQLRSEPYKPDFTLEQLKQRFDQ